MSPEAASTPLTLLVEAGPRQGTRVRLDGAAVTIGTAAITDLRLPEDSHVQRVHAEIVRDNDGYELRSLASAPVTVNNRPITSHRLGAGDRIRIGQSSIRVVADAAIEPNVAAAAATAAAGASTDPAAPPAPESTRPSALISGTTLRQLRLMPLWLRVYLAAIVVAAVYLATTSGTRTTTLAQVLDDENARALQLQRPVEETARVLRLLETAAAYESHGDRTSAYELYREVLAGRTPPDPQGPAARYAAQRLGALRAR